MNDNELMHYGVLGMKGGVRRARKLENKVSKSRSKNTARSNAKADKHQQKLDKINANIQKGPKFTGALLETVGVNVVGAVAAKALLSTGQYKATSALGTIGELLLPVTLLVVLLVL